LLNWHCQYQPFLQSLQTLNLPIYSFGFWFRLRPWVVSSQCFSHCMVWTGIRTPGARSRSWNSCTGKAGKVEHDIAADFQNQASGHHARWHSPNFYGDGDSMIMRGLAEAPGRPRIGFGEVSGTMLPARLQRH
jgi:hypothetical protein